MTKHPTLDCATAVQLILAYARMATDNALPVPIRITRLSRPAHK